MRNEADGQSGSGGVARRRKQIRQRHFNAESLEGRENVFGRVAARDLPASAVLPHQRPVERRFALGAEGRVSQLNYFQRRAKVAAALSIG